MTPDDFVRKAMKSMGRDFLIDLFRREVCRSLDSAACDRAQDGKWTCRKCCLDNDAKKEHRKTFARLLREAIT